MELMDTNLRNAIETNKQLRDRVIQLEISKQIASGMNFLHSLNPNILVKLKKKIEKNSLCFYF